MQMQFKCKMQLRRDYNAMLQIWAIAMWLQCDAANLGNSPNEMQKYIFALPSLRATLLGLEDGAREDATREK
jgi:hypothetical protein